MLYLHNRKVENILFLGNKTAKILYQTEKQSCLQILSAGCLLIFGLEVLGGTCCSNGDKQTAFFIEEKVYTRFQHDYY